MRPSPLPPPRGRRSWRAPSTPRWSVSWRSPDAPAVRREYLRHGQTPFFRLPVASLAAPLPGGTGAVLLGVPYDGGTTYRPGARLAPFEVRRVSALVQGYHPGHDLEVFDATLAVDGGNVVFPPFDAGAMRGAVQAAVSAVLSAAAVPFLVGGDHSIALPALRAVAARHGPVAVVHVDAHLDTSGPETWGEPFPDHADVTGHLAAHLLFEGLALAALGSRARDPEEPRREAPPMSVIRSAERA